MKAKRLFLLLPMHLLILTSNAQTSRYLNKNDGKDSVDILNTAITVLSDGYVTTGFYEYNPTSSGFLNTDGYIVKYDINGNIVWKTRLTNLEAWVLTSMKNGIYVLGGNTNKM